LSFASIYTEKYKVDCSYKNIFNKVEVKLNEIAINEITEREFQAANFVDELFKKMEYWDLEDKLLSTNYYTLESIHSVLSKDAIRENTKVPTGKFIF
jgi:hypothetical protein